MAESYILDPGEQFVRRELRSIMDVLPTIVASAVIFCIVIAGLIGFAAYHSKISFLPASIVMLVALLLVVIDAAMLLTGLYVYHHNYLVITNLHIIKVEQDGLFNQTTARLDLDRVQDVKGSRHGMIEMMLDYGDIEIETAGAQENFLFRNAQAPLVLADELARLHENYDHAASSKPRETTPTVSGAAPGTQGEPEASPTPPPPGPEPAAPEQPSPADATQEPPQV
jgi:membrane protein YdbS with pleckstrin-like domain